MAKEKVQAKGRISSLVLSFLFLVSPPAPSPRNQVTHQNRFHSLIFITNCISETPMMAVREMLARQLSNTRVESGKTYHLLVSFGFGEEPTEGALRKIETELCAKLGFKEHQRVAAVHRDTDNIEIVCITEPFDETPAGKLNSNMLAAISQLYSDQLSRICPVKPTLTRGKKNAVPKRGGHDVGEISPVVLFWM